MIISETVNEGVEIWGHCGIQNGYGFVQEPSRSHCGLDIGVEHCGVIQGDQQQVGRAERGGMLLALS